MVTAAMKLKHLLPGKKAMTNLDSVLKSRDTTLSTTLHPVDTSGCESWTVKKAEHERIDAFELWCWRKLLSPLDRKVIKPVHPKGSQP